MFRPLPALVLLSLFTIAAPPVAPLVQAAPQNRAAKPVFTGVLNLNTASAGEFEALPGIGAKTAALIVEYRQKNGPFKRVEDLMNIRGIGEKNFLKLKPQITVAPPKTDKGAHP